MIPTFFVIRNQLSHFCPNHKAAMSLRLCSKHKWPILVILVVATIIFIALYEVEIVKRAGTKITAPGKPNVEINVSLLTNNL